MSILFYDHLIRKEEIIILIDQSEEEENQRNRAKQLVDDIIHHEIINYILGCLEEHKHRTFLSLVEERPYDPEIISFLKDHISPTIEKEIETFAQKIISQIKSDIRIEE